MSKTILRLTEKAASVKVSDSSQTISLGTDLKKSSETLLSTVPNSVTAATWLSGIVIVTVPSLHGYRNNELVTFSGFAPVAYNVTINITVTGPYTFTFPLVTDPTVTTTVGTVYAPPNVSLYRVFATGNFDITRNSVVIVKSVSGQELDLDFSQMECVDNQNSNYDIVITPVSGVQVYVVLRKESGYATNFNPEQYGVYDDPSSAIA